MAPREARRHRAPRAHAKKQGIRIDGVGMQGHWGLDYPETRYIEAAIDSFAATGVKVMITELDVDVLPLDEGRADHRPVVHGAAVAERGVQEIPRSIWSWTAARQSSDS